MISQREQFNANNITVTIFLEPWVEENGIPYYIDTDVIPDLDIFPIGRSGTQLILTYNTLYTVNITVSLCGSNIATTRIATDMIYGEL